MTPNQLVKIKAADAFAMMYERSAISKFIRLIQWIGIRVEFRRKSCRCDICGRLTNPDEDVYQDPARDFTACIICYDPVADYTSKIPRENTITASIRVEDSK